MNRYLTAGFLFLFFLLLLTIPSCSNSPVSPDDPDSSPGISSGDSQSSPHHCAGIYALVVDTSDWSVNIAPLRSAQIHVNVTGILNATMGVGASGVPSESDPANGLFVMDITLTHPFGAKPQLTGFDVKGILMAPGSFNVGGLTFAGPGETHLENPDGLTRWWNPTEFTSPGMFGYTDGILTGSLASSLTATVNGYKYFADILGPNDSMSWVTGAGLDDDAGRGVFTAGSANTRRYRIRFKMDPGPQVVFGYAVDASWNTPSPNPPGEIPDDFPMDANQPEPFYVACQPIGNTLYYDEGLGIAGGILRLQINVHDWQGQAASDIASEITSVKVYIPGLSTNIYDAVFLNETSIKARYVAEIMDAIPTSNDPVTAYCFVESADGSTYMQTADPAPEEPLTSFAMTSIDIVTIPACVEDDNLDFYDAVELDLLGEVDGTVCLNFDLHDFYKFEIPPGFETVGEIKFYATVEDTLLYLYDFNMWEIEYIESIDGAPVFFDMASYSLTSGTYYLKVEAYDDPVTFYHIDMDVGLDPKSTDVSITEVTPDDLIIDPEFIFIDNDELYLIGDIGLWAFDITTTNDPSLISFTMFESNFEVREADYCNNNLYFMHYGDTNLYYLHHIDLTNPADPVVSCYIIEPMENGYGVCVDSSNLYLISGSDLLTYDISTPTQPSLVAETVLPTGTYYNQLLDRDGTDPHIIMAAGDTIFSYDISDPLNPSPDGEFTLPSHSIYALATRDDYVYVTRFSTSGYFHVLQQQASDIVELGSSPFPARVHHIAVSDNYAFLPTNGDFYIFDITIKSNPTIASTLTSPGDIDAAITDQSGDHLFLGYDERGLGINDISSLPMSELFVSPVCNHPMRLCHAEEGANDYALTLDRTTYKRTLRAIDITGPPNAVVSGIKVTGDQTSTTYVYENGIYVISNGYADFEIFNAANPNAIVSVHNGTAAENIYAFGIYGNYLYIAISDITTQHHLEVYNITNPASPVLLNTVNTYDRLRFMTFITDYFFSIRDGSILPWDITDPVTPVPLTPAVPVTSDAVELQISGNNMYVLTDNGFEIWDITDPFFITSPGSVVLFEFNSAKAFAIHGDYAFIFGYYYIYPAVVDISDPANPTKVMTMDWPYGGVFDTFTHDGFLYTATNHYGVRIFQIN